MRALVPHSWLLRDNGGEEELPFNNEKPPSDSGRWNICLQQLVKRERDGQLETQTPGSECNSFYRFIRFSDRTSVIDKYTATSVTSVLSLTVANLLTEIYLWDKFLIMIYLGGKKQSCKGEVILESKIKCQHG